MGAACHLPGRTVTWVQAIAKGEKMDQIVRDATELGATRIVPVAAERSIVRLQESPGRADARRERWERIAVEAARQCGRGDVPQIDPLRPLVSLWATVVADIRIVLQPGERTLPLHDVLQSATAVTSLAFAVGPEGGLTTEEISVALETGWITAHLGPFVLRTETVAAAVLGAVYMVNAW